MSQTEYPRKRVTFAPSVNNVNDTPTPTEEVCMFRIPETPETPMKLFLKSLKFFTFVFVVVGLSSIVMEAVTGINKIYLYFLVGLAVSLQATYYKFRIWMDPTYHTDCGCVQPESTSIIPSKEDMTNGVFAVLGHKKSALLLGVPNTVFGILFYCFMILINAYHLPYAYAITFFLTIISCIGSLYLWGTMIITISAVCVLCSTIHSISFLTLLSFLI